MSVPTALTTPPTIEGPEPVAPDGPESATARTVSEEVQKPTTTEQQQQQQQQQQQPSTEQVTAAFAPAPAPTPSGSA